MTRHSGCRTFLKKLQYGKTIRPDVSGRIYKHFERVLPSRWLGLPSGRLPPRAMAVAAEKLSEAARVGSERKFFDGRLAVGASPAAGAAIGVSRLVHRSLETLIVESHLLFLFFALFPHTKQQVLKFKI